MKRALLAGLLSTLAHGQEGPPSRALLLDLTATSRLAGTATSYRAVEVVSGVLKEAGWQVEVDSREVLLSLSKKTDAIDAWATGLPQQARIIEAVRQATGTQPLIVDSADILADPATMLGQVCESLGIGFDDAMLAWEAGPKSCDGIWARHWYDAVWKSTEFAPYRPRPGTVPPALVGVLEEVQPIYDALAANRIR